MNGKKPSWLLRAGSFLLAALMVFGNLYLPNGFLKASAEETNVLFSTDFEDYTANSSPKAKANAWRIYKAGTEITNNDPLNEVKIEVINGNKLLKISNDDGSKLTVNYPFSSSHYSDVTVSYYLAVMKPGDMLFPTVASYASEGCEQLHFSGYNSDVFRYKKSDSWYDATSNSETIALGVAQWHQVKIHYTTTGATVYIDGKETDIEAVGSSGVKLISMVAKSGKVGTIYVDNIKVTAGDHEPMQAPTTALQLDTVLFEENFQQLPVTTAENVSQTTSYPAAWYISKKDVASGYCIAVDPDPEKAENKALKIPVADGGIQLRSRVYYGPSAKQAVLEYRFYPTDDVLHLPSLSGGNENGITKTKVVNLIYFPGNGSLVYRDSSGADHELVKAADLAKNAWHTLKLAVDAEANRFYFYCDGKYAGSGNLLSQIPMNGIYQNCLTSGSSGNQASYFDDFKITTYVSAKEFSVSHSLVNLNVNGTQTITWNFAASDSAIQGVTIDDVVITNTDPSIATIDEKTGKITALKGGTTTITLDPVQEGLESKTVTVTVTGPVVNQVLYQTGFESTDAENFSEGSFGADPSTKKTSYTNWTLNAAYDGQLGNISIKKIGDNQVLSITNKCGETSGVQNCTIPLLRNGLGDANEVWVSYNVAVMSAQTAAYFPTPGTGSGRCAMFGTNNNQGFQWQPANNSWQPIQYAQAYEAEGIKAGDTVVFEARTWYTVELHYANATTNGTDAATVEVYIDGKLTNVRIWNGYDSTKTVEHLMMELNKWGLGETEMLVDNIQISTLRHTPAAKPAALVAETATIYYSNDLDSVSAENFGTAVAGWYGDSSGAFSIAENPVNGNNKAIYVNKTATDASYELKNGILTNSSTVSKAVLEYSVYYDENHTGTLYALTFMSTQVGRMVPLVINGSGQLCYQVPNATDSSKTDNVLLAQLTKGAKNTIKLVADSDTDTWYIWVNGNYIVPSRGNELNQAAYNIYGMMMSTTKSEAVSGVYFDDVKLYEYIPATGLTVTETTLELSVGESQNLTVSGFVPEKAAVPVAKFESSNTDVATVDATGKVTAVDGGEATITVTLVNDTIATPITVTVKVTGSASSIPYYSENFDNAAVNTLPSGWPSNSYFYVAADPVSNRTGNALLFNENHESGQGITIQPWTAGTVKQAVLEYELYFDKDTQAQSAYPLTFLGNDGNMLVMLILNAEGNLQYQVKDESTDNKADNRTLAALNNKAWNKIKLVADVETENWFIWINDTYIGGFHGFYQAKTFTSIDKLKISNWGGAVASTVYHDNIVVSKYVPATELTVAETEVTLVEGNSQKLTVTLSGEGASVPFASFMTNNAGVATVDAQGNITAVSEGQATITVKHANGDIATEKTVTVKVNAKPVVNTTYLDTGFEANETVSYVSGTKITKTASYNGWSIAHWGNAIEDDADGLVSIKTINGNQVLSVKNTPEKNGTSMWDKKIQVKYALTAGEDVWITYNAAVSSVGTAGFYPAPVAATGGLAAYFGHQGSNGWRYQDGDSAVQWDPITAGGAAPAHGILEWHKVKLHYTAGATSASVEMWIDGVKVDQNIVYGSDKNGAMTALLMELNHWGSGTETEMFIDNVKVTNFDHEPATPTAGLENPVVLNTGFETTDGYTAGHVLAEGTAYNGWNVDYATNGTGNASIKEIKNSDGTKNQVLTVSTKQREGSGNTDVIVYYNLPKSLNYAVLTYNVARVSDAGVLFFPSVGKDGAYATRFGSMTGLLTYWVKEIRPEKSPEVKEYGDPMMDLATTPANIPHDAMKWHKVKVVYERDTSTGYFTTTVWVDGIKTNVISYNQDTPSTDQVNRIQLTASKFGTGTMYIDNICLTTDGSNPELPTMEDVQADPIDFQENFSGWNVGDVTGFNFTGYGAMPGWSAANPQQMGTSIRVLEMNGNKVFALTRYDVMAEQHPIRYNILDRELKKATLTYNVAVSNHTMVAGFPSLTNKADGTGNGARRLASFGTNSGKLMYAPHGGGWFDVYDEPSAIVPYTWYNVKQTYEIDAQGVVTTELYINGVLTNVTRAYEETPNIASFLMVLNTNGTAGTMFIDNIHLTEGDLENEPVANDQLPALVDFFEDFESVTVTDGVGTWANAPDGYRVIDGTKTGKVLEIYHKSSNNAYTATAMTFAQPQLQTVIEYTLSYKSGTGEANLLTAAEANASPIRLVLNTATGEITAPDAGASLATIEQGKAYAVKLVVDAKMATMFVWVDGVFVGQVAAMSTGIASVSMQTVAGAACEGVYLDNITVKDYVPVADFSVTAEGVDNALVYKSYPIVVTMTPDYASVDAYRFEVVEGTDVVSVDAKGNITALKVGTAKIKVIHPSVGDKTILVNVTDTYNPAPIMEETFESYTDGANNAALVSGSGVGHYATVYDKNGNNVLQVSNPDKDNHAHAYIQFKDAEGNVRSFNGKVYMSYYLALNSTEGHFYIPTPGNNSGKSATISAHGDGLFKQTINGNDWFVLRYADAAGGEVGYQKMKWILIEFEATGGANPDLKMKINGRPVELKDCGLNSINSIAMQMTKWMINGNKDAYIDNIRVTEIPHEPMAAPNENLVVPATGAVILDEAGNVIDTTNAPYAIDAQKPIMLTVQIVPGGATDKGYTLTSSDTTVANIDTNGYLVGYESGEAVITATLNSNKNITASIRVKVNTVAVESITITSEKSELFIGGHCFATATVNPTNVSYSTIRWVSEDTNVVKVDSYGEIIAVGEGTAVVYAYSEYDEVESNKITITVTKPNVDRTITVSSVTELRAALDQVARINADGGMDGNIIIELAGGYYYLENTLKFGPEHSGTNGYSLIIRAKSGETPIIGGAYTVPNNWSVHDAAKNIYAVQIPDGVESRQMFVNNVRAIRARSAGGLTGSNFLYNSDGVNIGYTCYNTEFLNFARQDDLELVFKEQWTQPRCGVAQIRPGSKPNSVELIMDQPGWSGGNGSSVTNKGGTSAQADGPVWFENAYELLDEPGEWYLDTVTDTLYYIPRVWENMNEVKVTLPVFDNTVAEDGKYPIPAGDGALVHISGTFNDSAKNDVATQVQNIHFEGITFADTTWMRPSSTHGHSDAQNNHIRENGDQMAPGAVVVEAANAIWFNGCTFTRMGINALQLQNGAQNSFVIGNHFYDISGNAITVGEPGTDLANAYAQGLNTVKNNDILNNYIHNIGVDFGSSAAISVGFAADMDMSYNEIFDTPYSGWHIGYGWNNRFPNNNKNMLLEYNFVHDIMDQDIFDGGAFYFLGNMSGEGYNGGYSFLRRNYIRKQMNAHGGIYPDQGTTYLKIVENVVDLSEVDSWHSGAPKWSHTNQVCQHIHYINNFTTTDYHTYSNLLNFEKDDIVGIGTNPTGILPEVPDANWTDPVALDVVANAGLQDEYKKLRNNQVERVAINVDGDKILLDKNATFALQVTATDGRDNAITSGYHIYYASLNPAVATVSDAGVITGIASGIATIRVYVVSNGVLDQLDVRAVINDVPETISIKGVSDGITMSLTAIKTLDTKVITALGRTIEPQTVTFGVVNKNVAIVENGVLKPVSTGVTSLVVTATVEGVTLTEVFRVEIVDEMTYETVDVGEMFDAENEMYWYQNGTKQWVLTDDVSISSAVGNSSGAGFANYTGSCFENQLMSFKLKIANPGGWPSIVIRAQDNSGYVSQGPDGYIFCMGKGGLELYRFVDGVRYVIYGGTNIGWVPVPGAQSALTPAQSGFTYNGENIAEHDIKVGAIADGDYVRILLYVDGNKVIDFLDKEGAIVEPGYFGVVGKGETFTISKVTGMAAPETPAAEINGVTYPTLQAAIAAAHTSGQHQTVKVLEDTVVDSLALNGITLDLNGKELEVGYLIGFDANVIDSTGGSAVLKTKNISLPKDNAQMPVWDEEAEGYRLFNVVSYQKFDFQEADKFKIIGKPTLGSMVNDLFMAKAETNGLSVKVRLYWTTTAGNEVEQIYVYKPSDVATAYQLDDMILYLNVTGAGAYTNNLKVAFYIVSETGVEWKPDGDVFVGQ